MDTVISAIVAWKDLITKVFGQYPLAAALVTLAAIGLYFYLQEKERPGKGPTNILIVLFVWAIAVPILGFILTILGKVWDFVEAVAPAIAKALGSLYSIYDKHPILVLVLITIAILTYFAWKQWRPSLLPSRSLRIIALIVAVVVAAHITNPVANILTPSQSPAAGNAASQPSPSSVRASQPSAPASTAPSPTQSGAALPGSGGASVNISAPMAASAASANPAGSASSPP